MKFISFLNTLESHYCQEHTARKYLSAELNIRKLWKIYSSNPENIPVKESYFRMVFNAKYNLGFGSSRTDVCSTCLCLSEKIKQENNMDKKHVLMIEKRVHKLKYKAFFEKLKDPSEKSSDSFF